MQKTRNIFFALGLMGDGRARFLSSHGKISRSGDSAGWAWLQLGVSLGKCGFAGGGAGGWEMETPAPQWSFLQPRFL